MPPIAPGRTLEIGTAAAPFKRSLGSCLPRSRVGRPHTILILGDATQNSVLARNPALPFSHLLRVLCASVANDFLLPAPQRKIRACSTTALRNRYANSLT